MLGMGTQLAFPYHYGSHATYAMIPKAWLKRKFPYHYGSHATWKMTSATWLYAFPYHYGSHATRKKVQ